MHATLLGATGRVGTQLARQLLDAGHQVTAVVRDPSRLAVTDHRRLTVITAAVSEPGQLVEAVDGRDVALIALGSRNGRAPTTLSEDSTRAILAAAAKTGLNRLVLLTNSGMIDDPADGFVLRRVAKPILQSVLREPYADQARAENLLRAADLDWTIVRPPRLTNGRRTGRYRTAVEQGIRDGRLISRADVADAMIRFIDDPATIRHAVTIAY